MEQSQNLFIMLQIKIKVFLLSVLLFFFLPLSAQYVNNIYVLKNDSIECLKNISVYKEFQKLNFYDKAIPAWELTYKSCKGFKKIIYQDGVKFLTYALQKESDQKKRELLVDSLMHIYEERINFFGQEGYVRGRQGIDLLVYGNNQLDKVYDLLKKSFELQKNNTEESVIVAYMTTVEAMFSRDKKTKEEVVDVYLKCIETLESIHKGEKETTKLKNIETAIEAVDNIFGKSKAADCESLVSAFSDKFKTKKQDIDQVLKIQSILKGAGCVNEDLFFDVSVQVDILKPTAANRYLIAGLYLKKEEYAEANEYLKKAIEIEEADSLKAVYYQDMGIIYCHKLKQFAQARNNAYEALKHRPNWGDPYILIGDAYAISSASFGGSAFENAAVYWAAVDKYYKAKAVDPAVEKIASQKIVYYSNFFPGGEDTFMQGYTDGQAYRVGGWINENTTIRARK